MLGADGGGFLLQVLHFGQAQQQRLASRFGGAAAAVHADVEGVFHRVEDLVCGFSLASRMRLYHLALHDVAGAQGGVAPAMLWMANSSWATRQCRLRHWDEMRVRSSPSVYHPFRQARVIPIQQGGWI